MWLFFSLVASLVRSFIIHIINYCAACHVALLRPSTHDDHAGTTIILRFIRLAPRSRSRTLLSALCCCLLARCSSLVHIINYCAASLILFSLDNARTTIVLLQFIIIRLARSSLRRTTSACCSHRSAILSSFAARSHHNNNELCAHDVVLLARTMMIDMHAQSSDSFVVSSLVSSRSS